MHARQQEMTYHKLSTQEEDGLDVKVVKIANMVLCFEQIKRMNFQLERETLYAEAEDRILRLKLPIDCLDALYRIYVELSRMLRFVSGGPCASLHYKISFQTGSLYW